MSAGDVAGIATLIAAFAAAVVSIIDALKTRDVARRIDTRDGRTIGEVIEDNSVQLKQVDAKVAHIDAKVDTANELTLGQLGGEAETRRIKDKSAGDRTSRESRHIDSADERSTGA